ncbi:Type 1 glutamine amidotransferase-like domain-containing protein [Brachybacterium sp. YJGR34]|uniref:Type 1 glutamine amidotransferase-like domain-containing protein n=1 Tax=Brachybacterium sp. YJGR34 TaxID=2059911 RepID=UPI000E0A86D6|nr:Type 1 glutamine amidotransferase-like domain-containing protein [Brachybacterium sp. YJGR34]
MRLYLSSYQLGAHGDLLGALVRGARKGRVIANAVDGLDEDRRRRDTDRQIAALAALGLEATDLDLRAFDPTTIATGLGSPDFLWVRGGNVFTLRMALARSGLDDLIRAGLRRDAFVYAGYSAGACVLAPSLAGLERCDPHEDCRAAYGEVREDGLGVLDRPVVPHLESPGHPETELLAEVARRYRASGQEYWALRDGQALVVDGGPRERGRHRIVTS